MNLSRRDVERLAGLHPMLAETVRVCYAASPLPLTVLEGVRTLDRQREYVRTGASRTLNSRHLTGHAVDLGVMDGNDVSWHWPLYYRLAIIMRQAAEVTGAVLIWGGVWDRPMTSYTRPCAEEVRLYGNRWRNAHPGEVGGPLVDGPHYELARGYHDA